MCRRYVDDTFLLFCSAEHVEKLKKYLNKQHENNSFTSEVEQNGPLSFLDIKTNRKNKKFVTPVYLKPKFSGVCTNFESFVSKSYKRSLIDILLHGGFSLYSSMEKFHQEISSLKFFEVSLQKQWLP